jgi:hypothetical protein
MPDRTGQTYEDIDGAEYPVTGSRIIKNSFQQLLRTEFHNCKLTHVV